MDQKKPKKLGRKFGKPYEIYEGGNDVKSQGQEQRAWGSGSPKSRRVLITVKEREGEANRKA